MTDEEVREQAIEQIAQCLYSNMWQRMGIDPNWENITPVVKTEWRGIAEKLLALKGPNGGLLLRLRLSSQHLFPSLRSGIISPTKTQREKEK